MQMRWLSLSLSRPFLLVMIAIWNVLDGHTYIHRFMPRHLHMYLEHKHVLPRTIESIFMRNLRSIWGIFLG